MAYNIHCEKCGHEFEVEKWHPSTQCPKCQAADTVPMTKTGGPEPGLKPPSVDDKKRAGGTGWKNSPAIAGIAIVVIVAIWLGLGIWKFKKPAMTKYEAWAQCVECDEKVKKFTVEIPADCTKCGKKKTVYALYKCRGEEGKECDNVFAFIPPPQLIDPYQGSKEWEKLSEEEQVEAMIEHDKALKCLKCESDNTVPVYTEEQEKKFEELRKKYAKKNKRR